MGRNMALTLQRVKDRNEKKFELLETEAVVY